MRPVRIEGSTGTATKPEGWDESQRGHCGTLSIRQDEEAGVRFLRSAWGVEADEAGWLLAGAAVQVGLSVPQQPLMQMGIGPIPKDAAPVFTVQLLRDAAGNQFARTSLYAAAPEDGSKTGGTAWAQTPIVEPAGIGEAIKQGVEMIMVLAAQKSIL